MSNDYIIQRRIKHQKLKRKARRVEIAITRIYKFIRFIFILFIFYASYRLCYAHFWYLPQDIYTNKNLPNLEILGNKITNKDKIVEEMKKVPLAKKPIYLINPAPISRNIEKLPPIKRAYVRRYWMPARLVVMIEEVNPVFIIAPSEDAPAVAAYGLTGEFIPQEYLPLNTKFNVIKILSYGTKGDDYTKWDSEKISYLYNLCEEIQMYSGEDIIYLDLRQPNNVFVQIKSVKIRLGELDSTIHERIKSVYHLRNTIKSRKDNVKYVDLSWRDSIYLKENK